MIWILAMSAWAGEVDTRVGLALGTAADLQDRASNGNTRFSPGITLAVPLRIQPLDHLRIRLDALGQFAWGVDQLTWTRTIDGVDIRVEDADGHRAMLGSFGGEAGVDLFIPVEGAARPYVGGVMGVSAVAVWHAMRAETAVLLDPDQNDVGDDGNIDPWTLQPALHAGILAGLDIDLSRKVDLWVEIGYSAAFIAPKALRKSPPDFDARREAFGWNPVRATLGVTIHP